MYSIISLLSLRLLWKNQIGVLRFCFVTSFLHWVLELSKRNFNVHEYCTLVIELHQTVLLQINRNKNLQFIFSWCAFFFLGQYMYMKKPQEPDELFISFSIFCLIQCLLILTFVYCQEPCCVRTEYKYLAVACHFFPWLWNLKDCKYRSVTATSRINAFLLMSCKQNWMCGWLIFVCFIHTMSFFLTTKSSFLKYAQLF